MEKLLFDEKYYQYALDLIGSAQKEVLLSMFVINFGAYKKETRVTILMRALKEAATRGVDVKVLLSRSQHGKAINKLNSAAVRFLEGCSAKVRYLSAKRCCHAKILVVDHRAGVVGSHNWTRWALEENFELSVRIEDQALLAEIRVWFYRLFGSALPWRE